MEYAFMFITFGFGGALLLYALILRLAKDPKMIPRSWSAEMKDPKEYAKTLARILMFLALAFLAGGWVGASAGPGVGSVVLVICLILAIWLSVRLWRKTRP